MMTRTRWMLAASVGALLAAPGCYSSGAGDDVGEPDSRTDGDDTTETAADADATEVPADTDAAEVPADADASAGPWPVTFRLRFISDIPESVWVAAWDAAYPSGHWLSLSRDGAGFRKSPACDICMCDDCPGCPVCGAPCMEAVELRDGGSVEWFWPGFEYAQITCPAAPPATCQEERAASAGAYAARFCWGASVGGTSPCNEEILDPQCADVEFALPDPDGVVEYLIDHGG
ncbi:MAG: hypothetical protein HY907_17250 [Deltaproteobacteria bacterium]|nr:hypothetical protein [Deltaproteobacteria bacterium]